MTLFRRTNPKEGAIPDRSDSIRQSDRFRQQIRAIFAFILKLFHIDAMNGGLTVKRLSSALAVLIAITAILTPVLLTAC